MSDRRDTALPPDAARALDDLARFGVHLGLDHVRRRLTALGDPQRDLPAVLIAGTNGKGSTAALLAAMATAAGYRTGLYTSPHVETVEERIRVDGAPVDGAVLGELVLRAIAAETGDDAPPTYFETLTAAAFLHFRAAAVDLAVLEVGLGGRLDATNAADPVLSVITPVSLEHRAVLGDTLAAIVAEKAGVLRPDRPAVAWGADPAVRHALEAAGRDLGSDLVFADDEVELRDVRPLPPAPWSGLAADLATPRRRYRLETPLNGRHQAVNLALAVRAAERLADVGWERLDADAITLGAAAVRWPGRLEALPLVHPLPPPFAASPLRRVVLDAAHNPAAAGALATFLADLPAPPPTLIFGVLSDKEADAMLPPLVRHAGRLLLTRPPGDRGRDPRELLPSVPPDRTAEVHPDPADALDAAFRDPDGPETLLVCGSLMLLGPTKAWLRQHGLVDLRPYAAHRTTPFVTPPPGGSSGLR